MDIGLCTGFGISPIQRKVGWMKYIIFATVLNSHKMESKEYFEKVMQDYNQNWKGRSLRKYCKDEAVDYDWLIQYKKNYRLLFQGLSQG